MRPTSTLHPTRTSIAVHHLEWRSPLPVKTIHDRLVATVPRLDPKLAAMARMGDGQAVARERRDGPPLWLFEVRDQGSLLAIEDQAEPVYQYEIGNPLTAESMIRYRRAAGLYAPLRVILYAEDGASVIAYDQPSDLFGQFGEAAVTTVGHDLDRELEAVILRILAPQGSGLTAP